MNELTIARYLSLDGILEPSTTSSVRKLQAVLVINGITLLILRHAIATRLRRFIAAQQDVHVAHCLENGGLLAVSLVVPWLILLSITEADRLQRFWWLWPLQIMSFATVVTCLPLQLRLPRPVIWIGSLILVFLLAGNPVLLSRVNAWSSDGWSGSDAEKIRVVDYTARLIRSERKDHAAIGYQMLYIVPPIVADNNGTDRRYKVGAELDLLFKYRHGILNTNRCAEGVSADDEYRIVETSRSPGIATTSKDRINVPLSSKFHLLGKFGDYQVFERG